MTDKEFRRLSRRELVEIIYELQKQLAASQSALAQTREALNTRQVRLMQAGSLAEAALSLNDIFAHAQAAADQYVEDVNLAHSQAQAQAERITAEANEKAQAIVAQANRTAEAVLAKVKQDCKAMLEQARQELEQAKQEQDAISRWMNLQQ